MKKTTATMTAIKELVQDLGLFTEIQHIPDNDHCNETIKFYHGGRHGYKLEIELGGRHSASGAKEGWICLMYMRGGEKFELADPTSLDRLAAHLKNYVTRKLS